MNILAKKNGADEFAVDVQSIIDGLKEDGYTSLEAIAHELNEKKVPTPRGARWYASSVKNVLVRLNDLSTEQSDGE